MSEWEWSEIKEVTRETRSKAEVGVWVVVVGLCFFVENGREVIMEAEKKSLGR